MRAWTPVVAATLQLHARAVKKFNLWRLMRAPDAARQQLDDGVNRCALLARRGGPWPFARAVTCYFGPTVPVAFSRADCTQPETSLPVRGLTYITDDQPSLVCA